MPEHILFLTGHLARPRLEKVLARLGDAGFTSSVVDIGVKVAALMTEAIIARRLPRPVEASRVIVPGSLPRRPRTSFGGVRRAVRARAG